MNNFFCHRGHKRSKNIHKTSVGQMIINFIVNNFFVIFLFYRPLLENIKLTNKMCFCYCWQRLTEILQYSYSLTFSIYFSWFLIKTEQKQNQNKKKNTANDRQLNRPRKKTVLYKTNHKYVVLVSSPKQ